MKYAREMQIKMRYQFDEVKTKPIMTKDIDF